MSIEDELRATMRAYDQEAPTELDWTRPATRRRLVLPLLAAAAVVLLIAAVIVVVHRSRGDDRAATPPAIASATAPTTAPTTAAPKTTAPTCPAAYANSKSPGGWVPHRSEVAGTSSQLVPDTTPRAAVVCSYVRGATGRRDLTDLSTVPRALSRTPAKYSIICGLPGTSDEYDRYLLGLQYRDGTLWVSATNDGCGIGNTNGTFVGRTDLGGDAATALRTGRWPTTATATRCNGATGLGRLGDERRLVPSGATSVAVCTTTRPAAAAPKVLTGAALRRLSRALNALPARASSNGCIPEDQNDYGDSVDLSFRYPSGPEVTVTVSDKCRPYVGSTRLQSAGSKAVAAELFRLAGLR